MKKTIIINQQVIKHLTRKSKKCDSLHITTTKEVKKKKKKKRRKKEQEEQSTLPTKCV